MAQTLTGPALSVNYQRVGVSSTAELLPMAEEIPGCSLDERSLIGSKMPGLVIPVRSVIAGTTCPPWPTSPISRTTVSLHHRHQPLDCRQKSQGTNLFTTTGSIGAENPAASLGGLLLGDGDDVDRDRVKAQSLEKVLGVGVDVQLSALGVLGEVQGRDFRHVLILAFSLLFLQLEGNATHWSSLDTFHQMSGVAGDLVRSPVMLACSPGKPPRHGAPW